MQAETALILLQYFIFISCSLHGDGDFPFETVEQREKERGFERVPMSIARFPYLRLSESWFGVHGHIVRCAVHRPSKSENVESCSN